MAFLEDPFQTAPKKKTKGNEARFFFGFRAKTKNKKHLQRTREASLHSAWRSWRDGRFSDWTVQVRAFRTLSCREGVSGSQPVGVTNLKHKPKLSFGVVSLFCQLIARVRQEVLETVGRDKLVSFHWHAPLWLAPSLIDVMRTSLPFSL